MGHVLHTLADREGYISGVTLLENLLYVLRGKKSSKQIEVYDKDSYRFERHLTIRRLGIVAVDIVACPHNRCAYISNVSHNSIHRLALPDGASATIWPVNDKPACLSVTDTHDVLVTCHLARKIKEFSTDGKLLRQVQLSDDIVSPWHTIKLSSGQLLMSRGGSGDPVHRVCLLGPDGRVIQSYGGSGSEHELHHLAVDRNGLVFVADRYNGRVLLLSPSLSFVRKVVSRDEFMYGATRLCLDADNNRLYVADSRPNPFMHEGGNVLVIVL